MTFDLVIFDCDGTLVNSEYLNNKCVVDYLHEQGFTQYDIIYSFKHFMGLSVPDIMAMVARENGREIPANFGDRIVELTLAALKDHLEPVEDVHEVVAACAQKYKIAVASNGERANVLAFLKAVGLDKYFPEDIVFTKEMVKNAKPAPDLYLYAAARMGVEPHRCAVIEDSAAGAMAGKRAGMTVVGFTGVHHDPVAQEAVLAGVGVDFITGRLIHIPGLLDPEKAG